MPPDSPPATLVRRMRSSSEVLPWSTWPMMVTTGARSSRPSTLSSKVPRASLTRSSSLTATFSTSKPNSDAKMPAVSASRLLLMFMPIMPICMSLVSTSVAFNDMRDARICRLMLSSIRITRLAALGVVTSVFRPFLPGASLRARPGRPRCCWRPVGPIAERTSSRRRGAGACGATRAACSETMRVRAASDSGPTDAAI
jgi:hypothetical protein